MSGVWQSMQVAELWRLTVGLCGIERRQSVVCLRVAFACRSDMCVGRSPSAVEGSVPVGIVFNGANSRYGRDSSSATAWIHVLRTSSSSSHHLSSCFILTGKESGDD
jgi:hypothetical protein